MAKFNNEKPQLLLHQPNINVITQIHHYQYLTTSSFAFLSCFVCVCVCVCVWQVRCGGDLPLQHVPGEPQGVYITSFISQIS